MEIDRFVFATAVIGFTYALIQIPFAIYHLCTKKRLIHNECLPEFDFYADKVISFLLATGVGAGLAPSIELKNVVKGLVPLLNGIPGLHAWKSDADKFLDRGIIATGILFIGFLCMAVTSILSAVSRTRGGGFFA